MITMLPETKVTTQLPSTRLPHFHIMQSDYGDPLNKTIKTWKQAVVELRKERHNIEDNSWHIEGRATDGNYFFYEKRTDWMGEPLPCDSDWDFMLSIYTCTGEQPCPYEDCDE